MGIKQFAVLGDPIDHSLSPIIHQAAYNLLGLDWIYSRVKVNESELANFLEENQGNYAGLSLTMPLKAELVRVANNNGWQVAEVAQLLGSANTWLAQAQGGQPVVTNTDLIGAKTALAALPMSVGSAAILGSGATAKTLGLAILQTNSDLETLTVFSRRPEPAGEIADLITTLQHKAKFEWLPIEAAADFGGADLTVNTLPSKVASQVEVDLAFGDSFVFDVTYDSSDESLANYWPVSNRIDGRVMLVHQALEQLRLFGAFEEARRIASQDAVAQAMLSSIF